MTAGLNRRLILGRPQIWRYEVEKEQKNNKVSEDKSAPAENAKKQVLRRHQERRAALAVVLFAAGAAIDRAPWGQIH